MKIFDEILLKQDKEHMWTAIPSNREGFYHIKFYEYYANCGYKYLSLDAEYYSELVLFDMFKD